MRIDRDSARFLLILTTLGIASILGTWWPNSMHKAALRDRIAAAQERIRTDRTSISNLALLQTEVIDLQYALEAKTQQIPAAIDLAGLIRDLTGLMNEHRLSNQVISPLPEESCAQYRRLPLRVVFQAPSLTIFQFLRQVECLPRLVRIERLTIQSQPLGPQDQQKNEVTVTMDLAAIYAPPIPFATEAGL